MVREEMNKAITARLAAQYRAEIKDPKDWPAWVREG